MTPNILVADDRVGRIMNLDFIKSQLLVSRDGTWIAYKSSVVAIYPWNEKRKNGIAVEKAEGP